MFSRSFDKPSPRLPRRVRSRRGVTFMELVCLLLILAVLATAARPRVRDAMETARARSAALRVAADLNYARANSRVTGTSIDVQFNTGAGTYTLVGLKDPNHPSSNYVVDLGKTGYPAAFSSVSLMENGHTHNDISYDRFGAPYTGGNALASGSIVVVAGLQQKTVTIDPATGKATVP